MHIKSMVLEGFKSYGKRIEINGFDQEFNAITGLNGSGKSNILDAICFVLGISNLGQVRASSLQELVYKSGQAGIKKASVTIVFDNRNRESSPMGYEDYEEITVTRQVVIDGKNKYMINGSNVQNKRVQDMFCSVQLNVNNPHFLIMQGRITKVLNMKPPEILSMIEEAAGTKMYETKKATSLKLIEKKDSKLSEINEILKDELGPKIAKLKEERAQYMEYQRITRELEHCKRIYIAWKYVNALQNSERANEDVNNIKENIKKKETNITNGEEKMKYMEDKIVEIINKRNIEQDNTLGEIEQNLREAEKKEHKLTAEINSNKENIKAAQTSIKQLTSNIFDEENLLGIKQKEIEKVGGLFEKLKEQDRLDSDALVIAQEAYQKISSGLLQCDDGSNATLEQQFINVKQNLSEAQTEIKQCEMTLAHNKQQLNKKKIDMQSTETEYKKDNKKLEDMQKALKNFENELNKLNYKDGFLESLEEQKTCLKKDIKKFSDEVDHFESRYPQLRFYYKDPEPNFKRKSVIGLVCKSIIVKELKAAYALEIAAGGKLYNVMVDTELTGKKILKSGNLQSRVTIVPLNKVSGYPMDQQIIDFAQKLVGPENVQPALSLIDFPEETRPAMQWIFGNIFICKDMNVAKQVAYHNNIMKKCITLQGDVFDPSGILSGGAPAKAGSILLKLDELKEVQLTLNKKQQSLQDILARIENINQIADRFNSLKQQYNIKQHELDMVMQRLQKTTHHQLKQEVENLELSINKLKEKMILAKESEQISLKRSNEIEIQLKDADNIRERQLKEAENKLKNLKKKAESSRKEWQKREQEAETLNLEIFELKKTIENGKEQLEKAKGKLNELIEKENTLKNDLKVANKIAIELQNNLKARKEAIHQHNIEIQKLQCEKENILKQKQDIELEIKKLSHEVTAIKNTANECKNKITEYLRKHEWIEQEQKYFGEKGSMYDFETNNPEEMGQKTREFEGILAKLSRTVNARAMHHLNQEEEQHTDLLKKKKILEGDRKKILESIKKLDEKKKSTLLEAWERVNKDFGSIFNTLLPGADAKLEPPENQSVLDGLEVKIALCGVWKESLGELSGGQRSLVALSLILAMLLFKPAPLYILDEVDAALDLSHTENIGAMLKRHFKSSQFIVVSLKNGMFNNANVLFKTRFVDGMSTITRTERPRSK
ncbi:PREDICTED: structural maintenance of chromosomes protein 2 [Ceratosolen solmsi marchali]|uniref:Structural maintenance of chromosomes protein n=1 Tax=Ceratosolen solmsi marchali TaxID=326594 RepID=A0AAJ6YDQ0_9HYME|nr:PREDICTED: structural maintenance of chromosomes protein 2 [Ceratosolen solmsi marchali]